MRHARSFADEFARQRLVDKLAGLIEPIDRDERSQARPSVLAEKTA